MSISRAQLFMAVQILSIALLLLILTLLPLSDFAFAKGGDVKVKRYELALYMASSIAKVQDVTLDELIANSSDDCFTDLVDLNETEKKSICYLKNNGIAQIAGTNSDERHVFSPYNLATRDQAASFTARSGRKMEAKTDISGSWPTNLPLGSEVFSDVSTKSVHNRDIGEAWANGVIIKCGTNNNGLLLCPSAEITHGELAIALQSWMDMVDS